MPDPVLRSHHVRTLDDRIRVLRQLVWQTHGGLRDPTLRRIGLLVTDGCKGRDDMCELKAIFDFTVRNIRYTGDITGKDTFQSALRTLQFHGGDCFPTGTLFLTRDGFIPVEHVEPGDEVHDGETWVPVLKTWDRGKKQALRLDLDNGNALRLTQSHKVLRIPPGGSYADAEEVCISDVRPGDDLLQPRRFDAPGSAEISEDTAFLMGMYLAEGCRLSKKKDDPRNWVSLAGVANRKGLREAALTILQSRDVQIIERERELRFRLDDFPEAAILGRTALDKGLPTFRYGPRTIKTILEALCQGDGGLSTTGYNLVFSTISPLLALQTRVMWRLHGRSVHWSRVDQHGGAGTHPVYRLTVRAENTRRPWAKVKGIVLDETVPSFDIMTSTGRVYLPECDVIVRQCDDHAVLNAVLAMENGFGTKFRVTSNTGATWDHIYTMAAIPKPQPNRWVALDTTMGPGKFSRQPPQAKHRDFLVGE